MTIKIYKYPDLVVPDETPYQLQVGDNFRDFSLAQDVFDFIADKFPSETVEVNIQGERTFH